MPDYEQPQQPPRRPEDEGDAKREAGDRPLPTPEHIGHVPEDTPGLGAPVAFPPREE